MSASIADLSRARSKLIVRGDAAKHDFSSMHQYIRLVRELGVRDAEGVAEYGSALLANFKSRLQDDEMWQIYEDVAVAAADSGCLTLAQQCVDAINAKFPTSVRAQRLYGIVLEAAGSPEEAKTHYDRMLKDHPFHPIILKRKIALAVTSGDLMAAIDQLVSYVNTFQTDRQAWEHLCELYMQARLLDQARFCAEEVLVQAPGDVLNLLRLADLHFAQGGASNLDSALGYYCKAIELSKAASGRALYGALGTVCELGGIKGYKKDHSPLAALAAQKLLQAYEREAPDLVVHVQSLLEAQQLAR